MNANLPSAEIGGLRSTNYVTLYPLTDKEQRFFPLFQQITGLIHPFMQKREIHALLRQRVTELGDETDEGMFANKVLHLFFSRKRWKEKSMKEPPFLLDRLLDMW